MRVHILKIARLGCMSLVCGKASAYPPYLSRFIAESDVRLCECPTDSSMWSLDVPSTADFRYLRSDLTEYEIGLL